MESFRISYAKRGQLLLLLSFLGLAVIGTFLFSLPIVVTSGHSLALEDAFFMSCSSVCQVGLQSIPTGEFSWFGQLLMMLLAQCGCIGIMSLSAGLLLMIGKGLSFGNALMIFNLNDRFSFRGTEELVRVVIRYTFLVEAAGAVVMFAGFLLKGDGFFFSLWEALFFSVVSFCNSGFSLYENSLADAGIIVQTASMVLTIFGGFGVYVIYDLIQHFKEHRRIRLHSRIVLGGSAVLIAAGTVLLWLLSRDAQSRIELNWFDALFLSVNARTAGFTTVDMSRLSPACQVVLSMLMLIGGGPGSAAGGMKVTTFAIVLAAVVSAFNGHREVIIFHRRIPGELVLKAFALMVVFFVLAGIGGVVLSSFSPELPMLSCFFESASALTTTGLSIGKTTGMWTPGCKLFLSLFMLTGRVGPLTILLFLIGREKSEKIRYPEERIVVG